MQAYAAKALQQFQWRNNITDQSRLLTFVQYDRQHKTLHVSYIRFLPVIRRALVDVIRLQTLLIAVILLL